MITLKTLPQATAQEVFDQVKNHLLEQGVKAITSGSIKRCRYLTDIGLKCAAGCFIAGDEYSPEMEGLAWSELVANAQVPDFHLHLIRALQQVHDDYYPAQWVNELKLVAEQYNLKYQRYEAIEIT